MIYTKSKITISSWDVDMVRMRITDVKTTRIMGKVKFVCCDYEYGKEDVVGEIVEVDINNIAKILIYKEQEPTGYSKKRGFDPQWGYGLRVLMSYVILALLLTM